MTWTVKQFRLFRIKREQCHRPVQKMPCFWCFQIFHFKTFLSNVYSKILKIRSNDAEFYIEFCDIIEISTELFKNISINLSFFYWSSQMDDWVGVNLRAVARCSRLEGGQKIFRTFFKNFYKLSEFWKQF